VKFGPVAVSQALGTLLAHSLAAGELRLRKGRLLSSEDLVRLSDAGVEEVIVARMDADDVGEDRAAEILAAALDTSGVRAGEPATGRVNLFARKSGLLRVDSAAINRFNQVDPSITIATMPDFSQIAAGEMVATIKIIPLAVSGDRLALARESAGATDILRVLPFKPARVGLVATTLPSLKPTVMDKTARLLQARLGASKSAIQRECRVPHDAGDVAAAIRSLEPECDLIVVFGASAIVDPADVIPAGIEMAGGTVDHVGMPVDPGNLLVLGHKKDVQIIGAPGCARSPKENGFDWVLARILAGETPAPETIMSMGVGGLLKEIPSRPRPRDAADVTPAAQLPVDILVLAAGKASRMTSVDRSTSGGPDAPNPAHKLLAEFDGVPLIRKSAETALRSGARTVHVVIGYRASDMRKALDGVDIAIVTNPDFDEGMGSSLRHGVAALREGASGVLIMLADMPAIGADHLRKLAKTFEDEGGGCIVRAVSGEVRGNPVILPRETFEAIAALEGDIGARQIIATSGLPVVDVDIGDAALLDVDTREAVLSAGGVLKS
jgi:molybdenum cofactor cytidylyltransferase